MEYASASYEYAGSNVYNVFIHTYEPAKVILVSERVLRACRCTDSYNFLVRRVSAYVLWLLYTVAVIYKTITQTL